MASHTLAQYHSGVDNSQLLVALHGVTDNAASLADLAARFNHDYHVVLLDALGHGLSPRFTANQLQHPFSAMLDATEHTLEALGAAADPIILLGHSMGGALAAVLAARRPDLVKKVVLEDPAWWSAKAKVAFTQNLDALLTRVNQITDDFAAQIAANRAKYPSWPASECGAWAQAKVQVDRDFIATAEVAQTEPWDEVATAITVPCLVVSADRPGTILGRRGLQQIDALDNPHLQTALIHGAAHCVRRDNSVDFYRVVEQFLQQC